MRILITGAGGQLARELLSMLDRGVSSLGAVPTCYVGAESWSLNRAELDISQLEEVEMCISSIKPDLIFNCAAYTQVDLAESNPDRAMAVNMLGARNLAIMAEKSAARLVHLSTDFVFSGEKQSPYEEWDICNPSSVYGASKYGGEQYVTSFCRRYYTVRTSWLYGCNGPNFVKTILQKVRAGERLRVVNDQIGCPTNAEDLAYHLLLLAETEQYGLYHCSGNGSCSWYEFAENILITAGISCDLQPCKTEDFPRPAKRPRNSVLNHTMLRCTIGDRMRSWQSALLDYLQKNNMEVG